MLAYEAYGLHYLEFAVPYLGGPLGPLSLSLGYFKNVILYKKWLKTRLKNHNDLTVERNVGLFVITASSSWFQ